MLCSFSNEKKTRLGYWAWIYSGSKTEERRRHPGLVISTTREIYIPRRDNKNDLTAGGKARTRRQCCQPTFPISGYDFWGANREFFRASDQGEIDKKKLMAPEKIGLESNVAC